MRKRILSADPSGPAPASTGWLDLKALARVEVSSEDPRHPLEAALTA